MHHLNCLVLESYLKSLPFTNGQTHLLDAFSNSPDDCSLIFENFSLNCRFVKGEIYFYYLKNPPAKSRLFKPLFKEIHGLEINEVKAHPYERSFHFEFSDQSRLLFKCHGRKSNMLLFSPNEPVEIFRKNLLIDENSSFETIFRNIQAQFDKTALSNIESFKSKYPYLPIELFEPLSKTSEREFINVLNSYRNANGIKFNKETFELELIINNQKNELLEQMNAFTSFASRSIHFSENKGQLLKSVSKTLEEKNKFLIKTKSALNTLQYKRPDSEIGHIILSNLHLLGNGKKDVEMFDIYHQRNIVISIDPKLNGVENADRYFKKEKGLPMQLEVLKNKISQTEKEIEQLQIKLNSIEKSEDSKDLKPIVKSEIDKLENQQLPFRRFVFENWEILVGKHAESNEKLLNYYSDKNDHWLHAKDVSGSHVIIKSKGKSVLPDSVLETAASLAAYYSKNRKQNLVTVTYTLRKFVRKIKGAEKGKVTVSSEKTILVPPIEPDGLN